MLSHPHRSTAPGAWQGGGGDLLESGVPSSVIAVAKPGLSLIQRPQVGKLPEGQEEETPTSAAKAQTFSRPRREGGGRASSGVGFHLKTQVSGSKHELMGGSEPKPWAERWERQTENPN